MPTPPGAIDRGGASLGSHKYLGSISVTTTSSTTITPPTGAAPVTDISGKVLLLVVADAAAGAEVRVHGVTSAAGVVSIARTSATFGVPLVDDERVIQTMKDKETNLAAIASTGTAYLDIWELS